MYIIHFKYLGKEYIVLVLGKYNGKICGLRSDLLSQESKDKLKSNLPKKSLKSKVSWIKKNIPEVMGAYRTFEINKIQLLGKYEVK